MATSNFPLNFICKTYNVTPTSNAVVSNSSNGVFKMYAQKNISADVAVYGNPVSVYAHGYGDIPVPASYRKNYIMAPQWLEHTEEVKFTVLFMK